MRLWYVSYAHTAILKVSPERKAHHDSIAAMAKFVSETKNVYAELLWDEKGSESRSSRQVLRSDCRSKNLCLLV